MLLPSSGEGRWEFEDEEEDWEELCEGEELWALAAGEGRAEARSEVERAVSGEKVPTWLEKHSRETQFRGNGSQLFKTNGQCLSSKACLMPRISHKRSHNGSLSSKDRMSHR